MLGYVSIFAIMKYRIDRGVEKKSVILEWFWIKTFKLKKVDWWLPHASWGIETLLEEFFNCQFFDHIKYCQLAKKFFQECL